MLKTEFESLYGKHVTDEQYKDIERVYMACDFPKAEFVNEFKKVSKAGEVSPLLLELTINVEKGRSKADERKTMLTQSGRWLISLSDTDLDTIELGAWLRNKALELLDEEEYLKALLEMACPLREDDRKLMLKHL